MIIAIDGYCASGKTTLALSLGKLLNAPVIHMDHFFLRPCQRTPERLAETGGNIDYERFLEVFDNSDAAFEYKPFDCVAQSLGDVICVPARPILIVEGTYSHHPKLVHLWDYKIFKKADLSVRRERILLREGERAQRFFEEWIPKENAYFEAFNIEADADIVLL